MFVMLMSSLISKTEQSAKGQYSLCDSRIMDSHRCSSHLIRDSLEMICLKVFGSNVDLQFNSGHVIVFLDSCILAVACLLVHE